MRFVFRLLLIVIIVVTLVLGVAILMAVDDRATVAVSGPPSTADVARAKRLLARHDPRKLKAGAVKNAELGARDLNLLANYAVNLLASGAASVEVERGALKGQASIELPENPVGDYVNVEAHLQATDGLPEFQRLRVGSVTVPGWLANYAAIKALDAYMDGRGVGLVNEFIRSVEFDPGVLRVSYRWPADAVEQVRTRVVSPDVTERLSAFNDRLVQATRKLRHGNAVPLLDLMKPVFDLAQTRSVDGDPTADNRAAILVLSAYVNGRSLEAIVPEAFNWPQPTRVKVTLHHRLDLAQHYLTSAVLASMGSGALSDAVGLFKEVEDSRGGSGFSFPDLAADRAGTRFGELATASVESARVVHQRIARAEDATDIMPKVRDLPEGLSESEFKQRYGSIDSPAYRKVTREIEQRIDKTPLYR